MSLGLCVIPALSADGLVIMQRAQPLSEKLVGVARQNETVYELLKTITTTSVYGALALEVGSIAIAIASNHGLSLPGLSAAASDSSTEGYQPAGMYGPGAEEIPV